MVALETMTVNTFGFNVPCRRFLITANITRDRRMPLVDEFYMRVLKLCERVPVRRLGGYFGFSQSEMDIVTSELAGRGLVELDGDFVSLHPSAHDMFRREEGEGNIPRIMEIETSVEHVWFDLVSRNIMPAERSRTGRHLVEIKPDGLAREMPAAFARRAFEQNFSEYMRNVRRVPDPNSISLYSISGVEPGRFGYVVVKGREDLGIDPSPKILPHILEVEPGSAGRFQPLSEALWDAYRKLTNPDPSAAALAEFNRLTGDESVSRGHDDNGHFDVSRWYEAASDISDESRHPIVGATYIERNIEFFVKLLEARGTAANAGTQRQIHLFWYRPSGTGWGATPDLDSALSSTRGAVRRISRSLQLRSTLVVPQVSRGENNKRFERLFDEAYLAPAGHISPAIEILLVRDVGAIVTVHVRLSGAIIVPVGFVLFDPKTIAALAATLRLDEVRTYSELWRRAPEPIESDVAVNSDG
jgi:hypothetical protein